MEEQEISKENPQQNSDNVEVEYAGLSKIQFPNKEYWILGTAHVSKQSVVDVENIIKKELPHSVCIELDETRYNTMMDEEAYKKLDIFKVFREKKVFFVLTNIILSSYQRKIAKDMEASVGAEMMQGAKSAKENNIKFYLCDRDAQVTLLRAWRMSSIKTKGKLIGSLMDIFSKEEKVSEEKIEEMKSIELDGFFDEFSKQLPEIKKILIDERDEYLAKNIFKATGNKVLVVIGAGHKKGIIEHLKKLHETEENIDIDTSQLDFVPKGSKMPLVFGWLLSLSIISIIGWGVFTGDYSSIATKSLEWFAAKFAFNFIGGLITLANPISILVSSLLAPFTAFIPTVSSGIIGGLIQAILKKPTIEDLHNIAEDSSNMKKLLYKNSFVKPLYVATIMNVSSVLGTFIGLNFIIF